MVERLTATVYEEEVNDGCGKVGIELSVMD
jgi:hypothetical protein